MRRIKHFISSLNQNPIALVLFLCLVIGFTVIVRYRWRENEWKSVVQSDGAGYYAYLPAVFIYQDLQYRFYLDLDKKYKFGDLSGNFLYTHDGKFYNKYYCGTAIVQSPFFFAACLASKIFGYDVDGHSFPFHAAVNLAALFYVLAGMYFLSKYLLRFFNKYVIAIAIGAFFLGTNLFNYTVYQSSYSHAYSFSFICLFIYLADRSVRIRSRSSFVYLALIASLVVLMRPSNAVIIFSIPFIAGSWNNFTTWLKAGIQPLTAVFAILAGLAPLTIQSLLYYHQCGAWWIEGYPYEQFYFLDPHLLDALFSYRAGLFPYSPAAILAIPGLYFLWKKNKYGFIFFVTFFLISLWVMSSWWAWYYAGTFGMRPMVDYMSFIIIAACYFLAAIQMKWIRYGVFTVTLALTLYGQVLNYQVIKKIIPYDTMTMEKYWYIFLKTNTQYSFDLDPPYVPNLPSPLDKIMVKHYEFKSHDGFDLPPVFKNFNAEQVLNYSGKGEKDLISIDPGSLAGSPRYYMDLRFKAKYPSLYTSGAISVCFLHKGEVIDCPSVPVIYPQFKPGEWQDVRLAYKSHLPMEKTDEIVIRMKNGNKYTVLLQELQFTLATF